MSETWKDVVGYGGMYQVSDLGRVRSLDRVVYHKIGGRRKYKGKVLKPGADPSGHLQIILSKNGTKKTQRVHRLVTHAFIGPCPEGLEVRHGVGGVLDNTLKNLCYGTQSENMFDRTRDGTGNSKPVRRSDGTEYTSATEAAKACGLKHSSGISALCCKYVRPDGSNHFIAGGYGWEFI
jgi:hypothetical protein